MANPKQTSEQTEVQVTEQLSDKPVLNPKYRFNPPSVQRKNVGLDVPPKTETSGNVSETRTSKLNKMKEKLKLSDQDLKKREAFLKKLAAVRHMRGIGAAGGDMIGGRFEYALENTFRTDFDFFTDEAVTTDDGKLALTTGEFLTRDDALEASLASSTKTLMDMYFATYLLYPDVNGEWGTDFKNEAKASKSNPQPLPTFSSIADGGGMRVGPVIFAARTLQEAIFLAERTAMPSHGAPMGIKGTTLIASVGWLAKNGYSKDYIRQYCIENYPEFDWDSPISHYQQKFLERQKAGQNSCPLLAPDANQVAVLAFLEGGESYEEVVALAISAGGDSDTIAAMAGAIAEAAYGIPESVKADIMGGLDQHELTQAINFDAYAARKEMEMQLDAKYADSIVCGQKPREIYENILKEKFSEDKLKELFGDDLPEELKGLSELVLGDAQGPDGSAVDYEKLNDTAKKSADALEKLYQKLNKEMIDNFDADAVERVTALNELVAVVKGLSKAPVIPERSEERDAQNEAYQAMGRRAEEIADDMFRLRMEARIPPKGANGKTWVVIEPKTREYELAKRAEQALRKMQDAVKEDCFKKQGTMALDAAKAALEKSGDLAAIYLHENIRQFRSIASLNPKESHNAERRGEIENAKFYLKAFENGDLDTWIETAKQDEKYQDFVKGLNIADMKTVLISDKKRTALATVKYEDIPKYSEIRDSAEQMKQQADKLAKEEEEMNRSLIVGKKTQRSYELSLKGAEEELNQMFPKDSLPEQITVTEYGRTKTYNLNNQLQNLRDELRSLLTEKSDEQKMICATDMLDTLDVISKCLAVQKGQDTENVNLEKQQKYIEGLTSQVKKFREAPVFDESDENGKLYQTLGERIKAIDDRMYQLTVDAQIFSTEMNLAKFAKTSMEEMQGAIKKDYERGDGKHTNMEKVKERGAFAGIFVYQQIEDFIEASLQRPKPGDSMEVQARIKAQADGARMLLNEFHQTGNKASSIIEKTKGDKAYQFFEKNFTIHDLNEALKKPGAMREVYGKINKQLKVNEQKTKSADVKAKTSASGGKKKTTETKSDAKTAKAPGNSK